MGKTVIRKACQRQNIIPSYLVGDEFTGASFEEVAWDDVLPLACFAYNCFPHEFARESPFFLMFGRDPLLPLNDLLRPRIRYLGEENGRLNLQALQNIFAIATFDLEASRAKRFKNLNPQMVNSNPRVEPNSLVLIKDHVKGKGFNPRFSKACRVIRRVGSTKVQVRRLDGKIKEYFITDVKPVSAEDVLLQQKPKPEEFGRWRPGKYAFHPERALRALGTRTLD